MRFIEELVAEEFLPTFRSMLAEALRARGLTQSEVAEMLGISQSAVSKYAHGEVERREPYVSDERVRGLVERVADGLAEGHMSRVAAVVETEVLIRELEARGDLLARRHEEALPELADYEGDFRVHDADNAIRTRERVRSSVRRGLSALEATGGFAALIPAVGSNLVECVPDAEGIDEVAGVPGRIFDVAGKPTIPGDPEFGVSAHVAGVLLAARRAGSDARAALNVKYSEAIVARLADAGYSTAEFDAETGDLDGAVADALDGAPQTRVLYQTGGFGVEPIVYLLGPDAEAVVRIARELT